MYLHRAATPRSTPQSEPIPGSDQIENSAGGYAWQITPLQRLRRWLILGSEGGTYYVGERDLTKQNIQAVRAALDECGVDAVSEIVAVSKEGRAPKNDPALYALAIACAHQESVVRSAALAAIPEVARTGTHLFRFAAFVEGQRGWGRGLRRGVSAWYERDLRQLAYQVVKYRQRDGWTHGDLLRLAHPVAPTKDHAALYNWVCGRGTGLGGLKVKDCFESDPRVPLEAFEAAQCSRSNLATAELVKRYGNALPREALKPEHLTQVVWEALLDVGMPLTALMRNLPTLTRLGVIAPLGSRTSSVVEQLTDGEALRKARVHPFSLLVALATYAGGHSLRGSSTWQPVREIVDALDEAFYASFRHVPATGKRHVLALDCSHSMNGACLGSPLSCMSAAATMAMVTDRVEERVATIAFHGGVVPLTLSSRQRLDDVMVSLPRSVGRTDCALPMLWALDRKIEADVFVLYSDNETWYGNVHPKQALDMYRQQMGIDARLVVVSMIPSNCSIADPDDMGMLDLVGFDTTAPQVISEFVSG